MVKSWVAKAWSFFKKEEFEEIEVPRHEWVRPTELYGSAHFGKRVEVPVVNERYGGQTNVVGRLMSMSYDSFDAKTTLTIDGPHFVAVVDIYPDTQVMVHL